MVCICGHIQINLIPCPYVCAVIQKMEYHWLSMFHIWWHKICNYYHRSTFSSNVATNLDFFDYVVNWKQQNYFRASCTYKRVYVKESLFLKNILPHEKLWSQVYDDVLNLMICIVNKNRRGKPVVKDTLQL